jgi:glyceraldehyde-3-phosphate dehydrogenase (NAD(P))
VVVWEDSVTVGDNGREVYLIWATPNESNVVPENIDAIRAVTEKEEEPQKSIRLTDESLGVVKRLY